MKQVVLGHKELSWNTVKLSLILYGNIIKKRHMFFVDVIEWHVCSNVEVWGCISNYIPPNIETNLTVLLSENMSVSHKTQTHTSLPLNPSTCLKVRTHTHSSLTLRSFREHAGQSLDAHLELDVPDPQDLVFGEADELSSGLVELDLDYPRHVTSQHLWER